MAATRTRNEWDRKLVQTFHGERNASGQTPRALFLALYNSCTTEDGVTPRVSVLRHTKDGGYAVKEHLRTREEVLQWAGYFADGNLLTFDADDYSARLILNDGHDLKNLAWIELLYPGSDAEAHPELEG